MRYYDVMQVCLKDHQISAHYNSAPERRQDFCKECGARTIFACPKCKEDIRGEYEVPGVATFGFEVPVPPFCHKCGEPYPWTRTEHQEKSMVGIRQNDHWESIEFVCGKFHSVARQIKKRYNRRPSIEINDEYDVQDLLHALLKMFFDDIRPEEYTPSYAGGAARMDFLLKSHGTVIEVKKTRKGLSDKEIGNQLLEDIARYREHRDCRILVCFIYDPEGILSNPKGLIKDLSDESEGFSVRVLIHS